MVFHEQRVRGVDPQRHFDELSMMAIRLLYDGLYDYDHDGNPVPQLAEALPVSSADGLTHTVRLRAGARFHSGDALLPRDVERTFAHLLSPLNASPFRKFFQDIKGAAAFGARPVLPIEGIQTDARSITFTLDRPDYDFARRLAMTGTYPVAVSAGPDGLPIGTGPFRLESWERGTALTFRRVENYWDNVPRAETIVYLENVGRARAWQMFEAGKVHLIHRMTMERWREVATSPRFTGRRSDQPADNAWGLAMNCELPPFDDVHVRRAVAYALDREEFVRTWQLRDALGQPIPRALVGHDPELPHMQRFDLEAARRELALAGHPGGLSAPVRMLTGEGERSRAYATWFKDQLARIGIDVEVEHTNFGQWLQRTGTRGREQMLLTGWNADIPVAHDFLQLFESSSIHETGSNNRAFYTNPELDELVRRSREAASPELRIRLAREASSIVAHDAPWAFLHSDRRFEVWARDVCGYRPHPFRKQDYRNVWVGDCQANPPR